MNCLICGEEIFPDKNLRGNIKTGEFYCLKCAVEKIPENKACPECEQLKVKLKEYEERDSDDYNYWKNQHQWEKLQKENEKLKEKLKALSKEEKS